MKILAKAEYKKPGKPIEPNLLSRLGVVFDSTSYPTDVFMIEQGHVQRNGRQQRYVTITAYFQESEPLKQVKQHA